MHGRDARAHAGSLDRALVTVCVPAYNARAFIARTLASLADQDLATFQVMVSVDVSTDGTAEFVERIAPDDRFVVRRREHRLGWAGNVNSMLDEVTTRYACVVAHDDTVSPNYLSALVARLESCPSAAFAMPASRAHGLAERVAEPYPITGDTLARVDRWLAGSLPERLLPWRALVRREFLAAGLRLRGATEHFGDALWSLDLVLAGQGTAAPAAAYDKWVRPDSMVRRWEERDTARKGRMLADHVAEVIATLVGSGLPEDVVAERSATYVGWALQLPGAWSPLAGAGDAASSVPQAVPALSRFVAGIALSPAAQRMRRRPRVLATLLVRDEEDIVADTIDHHLAMGVEHVLVTDHASTDGTAAILAEYVRRGRATVTHVESDRYEQAAWVTVMAREAAALGADWVVHLDADEFAWTDGMDLPEYLSGVPVEVATLRVPRWNVVPLRTAAGPWWEGPMARDLLSANSVGGRIAPKILHRAGPAVVLGTGNHCVEGLGTAPPVDALGLAVLHVPYRSFEEFAARVARNEGLTLDPASDRSVGAHWRQDVADLRAGRLRESYLRRLPEASSSDQVSRWQSDDRLAARVRELRSLRAAVSAGGLASGRTAATPPS